MKARPGEGVGAISIGMTRAQVEAAMGEAPHRFQKSSAGQNPVDAFDSHGIHVYYDDSGQCEYIECFPEAETPITIFDVPVLSLPASVVLSDLASCALQESEGGCSYTDVAAGFTLWRSFSEAPRFETVGIARPSYFEPRNTRK